MRDVVQIDLEKAKKLLGSGAKFVDVRDPDSYAAAHVPGAMHLSDRTVEAFVTQSPKDQPVVVYCYHGHTSLGGAAYLMDQGFTEVYSLIGGFELWRQTEETEG